MIFFHFNIYLLQIIIFRVVRDFSDIFQPMIVSLFMWSLLAISAALLIIDAVKYI